MVPNAIPAFLAFGLMGLFGIPLDTDTLLIAPIILGIAVDDTIHYLAKYRQELKTNEWNLKACINNATREAGLGMFYTSIVLFSGFSVFTFSQFGGTQALGMLVSITLLIAMLTNLMVLPSLLLSLDRLITTKSFKEPYFEAYEEEDEVEWNALALEKEEAKKEWEKEARTNKNAHLRLLRTLRYVHLRAPPSRSTNLLNEIRHAL